MPALEIFANNAQCKLAAPIDAIQTTITVTPPLNAGFPFPSTGNFRILIDNEDLLVTAVVGLVWTVVRGVEVATTPAAAAAPHAAGALVSQITTSGGFIQAILDRVVWNVSAGTASQSVTAFASLAFSDSNGVSFGLNGSTITASVATGAASINISAGTTSNNGSAFTLSNANNVSFGLNGSVITASAGPTGAANINLSAGTTSNLSSAFTLSNSNNVSFGLNAGTLTASASFAINFSGGTTSNNLSAITFADSNGISFGLNGSTMTASVATSLSNINVSAGTTSNNLSAITFSNGGGVSFGLNGSTITAAVAGTVGTITAYSQDADFVTNFAAAQGALSLQKLSLPMNLLATQLALLADFRGRSNASDAVTVSHAVYTLSAGTASLASSGSRAISWGVGSATSASTQYGGVSGTRYRTVGVSYAMTPGDYLFAWWISTANGVNAFIFGRAGLNIVGTFDGIETNYFLNGSSVSSVVAFPASIAATDPNYARTGLSAMLQPGAILVGTN